MALNAGFTTLDASNNTFSDWLSKTNTMIDVIRDDAVTANSTGAETTGDAKLFGTFVANTIAVHDALRGGDYAASANLEISSNVTISGTVSATEFDSIYPTANNVLLGNSSLQWDGYFSDLTVSGTLNASVTGNVTGNITGNVTGNLIGDVYASDGVSIVLDSGTNGFDASFTGDVTGDISSTGTSTFATVDINGGAIDGTAIGAASTSSGAFTTISASGNITGNLVGNVTGDLTGDVTANAIVTENITANNVLGDLDVQNNITANTVTATFVGDVTGDVTANAVSTSFLLSTETSLSIDVTGSIVEIASNGTSAGVLSLVASNGTNFSRIQPATSSDIVFTLPNGNNQEIVGTTASQTITNKSITANTLTGTVQSLTGSGAVNLTDVVTEVTTSGGAAALTLADGTNGQIKIVTMVADDGNDATLTPTTKVGFTSIIFNDVGDSVTLMYSSVGWVIAGLFGANTA